MTMSLEVDGVEYETFESASCLIQLDALSNSFTFDAVNPDGLAMPFTGGEKCIVKVNGVKVVSGRIEIIDGSYSIDSHQVTIGGRDLTSDIVSSSIGAISDLRSPITLKSIIELVIKDIGSSVKVIDDVSPPPFDKAQDIIAPEPGQNAFSFIEKYARKRQVLLTSDADGNLVIVNGTPTRVVGAVQHMLKGINNNVISAQFQFDISERFNIYKSVSQLNPIALNVAGAVGLDIAVDQQGFAVDDLVPTGRQMVLVAEASFSDDQNLARATWEANIRKARSNTYTATVFGHTVDASDTSTDVWLPNRLYQISDDFYGKSEPMLCNSVKFTFDVSDGSQTELGFVDRNAYSLELDKPRTDKTATLLL